MIIARVVGNAVCTEKDGRYRGRKILVVRALKEDRPAGAPILAVDGVQAGVGDTVVVFDEGGSARQILGDEEAVTIRTVVGAIVDEVTEGE